MHGQEMAETRQYETSCCRHNCAMNELPEKARRQS